MNMAGGINVPPTIPSTPVNNTPLNNNLIDLIIEDSSFNMSKEEILSIMDPKNFVGRAPEQVVEFVNETLEPAIYEFKDLIEKNYKYRNKV